MYIHVHVYIYIYMPQTPKLLIYIYIYMSIYIHTYTYIYMYIHVHVYIYIFVYKTNKHPPRRLCSTLLASASAPSAPSSASFRGSGWGCRARLAAKAQLVMSSCAMSWGRGGSQISLNIINSLTEGFVKAHLGSLPHERWLFVGSLGFPESKADQFTGGLELNQWMDEIQFAARSETMVETITFVGIYRGGHNSRVSKAVRTPNQKLINIMVSIGTIATF